MNDPLWLSIVKIVVVFVVLLTWTIFNVWFERRVLGRMQNRQGPTMNGPFGLGQAMGDGVKLIFKEDFRPAKTDGIVFNLAPYLTALAAFTMWSVIPLGGQVRIFGHTTSLQIAQLPVSMIFIFAIAGLGIYGLVLAGWASSGTYSLFGSMRATAQLISYEVAMGLAIVAVAMYAGSLSTNQVVDAQAVTMHIGGLNVPLPGWYALLLIPSFLTYIISMFGETNRLPFDLAECESELLSGHITDYSGFRYAIYFLAEYINVATVSAVATTLFLGGYRAPWPFNVLWGGALDQGWFTLVWFLLKVQLLIFFMVWVRAALPRFRYDHFMSLGWKVLIPANLIWILLIGLYRKALAGVLPGWVLVAITIVVVAVVIAAIALSERRKASPVAASPPTAFDAYAGGYPVPPKPGTQLPELAGLVDVALTLDGQTSTPRRGAGQEVR
ncbi:MAG: NADH-quinone oxidoreductase subunit NuoH [Propionibacteriaceae bacterium]|nr:NADH-quinone oxidoreductase subunit NuoH [Propionibacteriaceae bacterium]